MYVYRPAIHTFITRSIFQQSPPHRLSCWHCSQHVWEFWLQWTIPSIPASITHLSIKYTLKKHSSPNIKELQQLSLLYKKSISSTQTNTLGIHQYNHLLSLSLTHLTLEGYFDQTIEFLSFILLLENISTNCMLFLLLWVSYYGKACIDLWGFWCWKN